jgi:glyceraldehyde 3-phosphate dehydrogenase
MKVLSEKDPAKLPWKDLGVDLVLESTGRFTDRDQAALHLTGGAKRASTRSYPTPVAPPTAWCRW